MLRWRLEELASTPSRELGIEEKIERVKRFEACNFARNLIRNLFGDEKALETKCNQVQMVACYYLQLFYMFHTVTQEDSRLVAAAAAFLACKIVDVPRTMKSLLRTFRLVRVDDGEAEFGEDEQKRIRERIVRVEFVLLRILRFDVDPKLPREDLDLPLTELGRLTEKLLAALAAHSKTFQKACAGRPPTTEADAMRQKLLHLAERLTFDSFMGLAPLLAPPRFIAAGALAVATRYLRREMVMSELLQLLAAGDSSLGKEDMKHVIEEILNVFRTKTISDARRATRITPGAGASLASASTANSACTEQRSSSHHNATGVDGLQTKPQVSLGVAGAGSKALPASEQSASNEK